MPVKIDTLNLIKTLPKTSAVNHREGMQLYKLAHSVPENGVLVEIGSCMGISTCYLAAGSPASSKVYAIDLWTLGDSRLALPFVEQTFHRNIKLAGFKDRVTAVKDCSENVAKSWDSPIDLLFIDGDHSYEGVKADILNWSVFIKEGGIIAFHDIDRLATVKKAVLSLLSSREWKPFPIVDKIWSARKR